MNYVRLLLTMIGSYLIGSILTGAIVARLKRVNIRSQGSGNIGATNVYRSMGKAFGVIVLLGDVLKGVIAVMLGRLLGRVGAVDLAAIAGICAIIGHNWSLFAGFRGGKGIATSLGVLIALIPLSLLAVIPVWLLLFLISGYVSLASVVAAIATPVSVFLLYPGEIYKIGMAMILGVLAVYRHQSNIIRLIRGEEHRFLYKAKRSAK